LREASPTCGLAQPQASTRSKPRFNRRVLGRKSPIFRAIAFAGRNGLFPLSFLGRERVAESPSFFPLSLLGRERVAEGRERVVKKSGACRR
jgi:hypothetical protein